MKRREKTDVSHRLQLEGTSLPFHFHSDPILDQFDTLIMVNPLIVTILFFSLSIQFIRAKVPCKDYRKDCIVDGELLYRSCVSKLWAHFQWLR